MYDNNDVQQFSIATAKFVDSLPDLSQIEQLRDVLRFHEWRYYVENNTMITDGEYDILFNHLRKLEKENPQSVTPDSPTQRVATALNPDFPAVKHIIPMLSLGNAYGPDDLRDFNTQILKLTGSSSSEIKYTVEPKFDGGSVALVYENNILIRAATRGNGQQGEEMTPNARTLPSVPLRADFLKYNITKAELRGEAVIRKDFFHKMNEKRAVNGEAQFANPRNTASGGLRTKNPQETRSRGVEIFVFQFGYAVDDRGRNMLDEMPSHSSQLKALSQIGFKVPKDEIRICANIEEVISYIAEWDKKRDSYAYEIDGMVIKVNDTKLQEKCGSTGHHPRWAIAYKFKAKQANTILEDVEYQVGKIGSITPVAKVKPVHLAGVTVSSISMHNEEFITSKDLRIGDTIVIERAGDVIPYIVRSLPKQRDGSQVPLIFPTHCPIAPNKNVSLIKAEGEAAWRCIDCKCGRQDLMRMIFHVGKDAMDIDGFGKSYVEKFHEYGWIKDIGDIYNLGYDQIKELEGFGQKSANNLEKSIDKAKQNPIHKLLHSLSIHHLGKKASKLIAEQINHVMELKKWDVDRFLEIPDIGPVVANNVVEYFSFEQNIALLERMESYGVNMNQKEEDKPLEVAKDAPLSGKTILFTGSLQHITRKQAQQMAAKAGAKNISAVSSNLNILVVGEKAGSKLKKAEALITVEIMTEDNFIKIINL
ncbi:MAG: NAD-dependent DNA ligase LigA [Saprospiraceae bacterium]